jgi:mannose-6-phosphate isomerase
MLYPLTFKPIFKERVWGGRNLETLYHKPLPPDRPVGESWEITDRPEGVSVIANGPWAGRDLRWLMEHHPEDLLGPVPSQAGRFPLLVKILDAHDVLSLQVHPPPRVAAQLHGEPKTEMWYIAQASPEAVLYAGLKAGVTQEVFRKEIGDGTVAGCLHRLRVQSGDALFLPSGRVHAIGAGNVIFEIQQNSDTTYRVFDWNRAGLDGRPRELHLEAALASIDFQDFEPRLIASQYSRNETLKVRYLIEDPLFLVDACRAKRGLRFYLRIASVQILGLLKGTLSVRHGDEELSLQAGDFCLLPASLERVTLEARTQVEYLHVQPGQGS